VRVHPVDDPRRFWDELDAARPDVVILDVDMPGVNGLELCQVMRNDARWRSVPVLFLTASTDQDTVSRVFASGADDYVAKPIVGPELVNRIANRLERVHLLRHLAETDPLTGVANRRRSIEQMEQLIRLASRQARPFSLAILDLDHFKRVNDRWGHAMGDEVIKRVARLLARHFRGEDVVARWGGEEFVVGLFGMSRQDAVQRLCELQDLLAAEHFGPPGGGFTVTLSGGVAEHPLDGGSIDALYQAADGALYQAKQAGRDRVLPAGAAATGAQSPASDP
jgi:diguanylate cyclase (GGDEF)-like protein